MNRVGLAGQPYYCSAKVLLFVLPAMFLGTIDFNHFIPLSLTLTLPGGHKVSAKQNLLASFSCLLFI